jgi:hypothetical protein
LSASRQNGSALERRLTYGIGVLSLLLILVVANSFFHSDENPLNPIAAAAERTQSQPGARFTMRAVYTSDSLPRPMIARGTGAYNTESGLSEANLRVDSPTKGWIAIQTIGDGTSVYMGGTALSGELPDGKAWMKIEPFLGHSQDEMALSGSGADESLGTLSNVHGGAELVGRERVRGVPTKRYRTQVSFDEYSHLLREEGKDEIAQQIEKVGTLYSTPPVVEGWIDTRGILRRMRMVMTIPLSPGQPAMTMDMKMDLFDIGAHPAITLPDSSNVYDATPLVQEQLDAIDAG